MLRSMTRRTQGRGLRLRLGAGVGQTLGAWCGVCLGGQPWTVAWSCFLYEPSDGPGLRLA